MNTQTAINIIMARLGNRTDTSLRAQILQEMQLALDMQCHKLDFFPWFLATSVSYPTLAAMTVGSGSITPPSDFWGLDDDTENGLELLHPTTSERFFPKRRNAALSREADYAWNEAQNATPTEWDLWGSTIITRPNPDVAYRPTLYYYKKDTTTLADDTATCPWLTSAPDVLLGYTGYAVARFIVRDDEAAQMFTEYADLAIKSLRIENEKRKMMGRSYAMGED